MTSHRLLPLLASATMALALCGPGLAAPVTGLEGAPLAAGLTQPAPQDDLFLLARRGRGADDGAGHQRRGRGKDDGAGHAALPMDQGDMIQIARRGRGRDDGPRHG